MTRVNNNRKCVTLRDQSGATIPVIAVSQSSRIQRQQHFPDAIKFVEGGKYSVVSALNSKQGQQNPGRDSEGQCCRKFTVARTGCWYGS